MSDVKEIKIKWENPIKYRTQGSVKYGRVSKLSFEKKTRKLHAFVPRQRGGLICALRQNSTDRIPLDRLVLKVSAENGISQNEVIGIGEEFDIDVSRNIFHPCPCPGNKFQVGDKLACQLERTGESVIGTVKFIGTATIAIVSCDHHTYRIHMPSSNEFEETGNTSESQDLVDQPITITPEPGDSRINSKYQGSPHPTRHKKSKKRKSVSPDEASCVQRRNENKYAIGEKSALLPEEDISQPPPCVPKDVFSNVQESATVLAQENFLSQDSSTTQRKKYEFAKPERLPVSFSNKQYVHQISINNDGLNQPKSSSAEMEHNIYGLPDPPKNSNHILTNTAGHSNDGKPTAMKPTQQHQIIQETNLDLDIQGIIPTITTLPKTQVATYFNNDQCDDQKMKESGDYKSSNNYVEEMVLSIPSKKSPLTRSKVEPSSFSTSSETSTVRENELSPQFNGYGYLHTSVEQMLVQQKSPTLPYKRAPTSSRSSYFHEQEKVDTAVFSRHYRTASNTFLPSTSTSTSTNAYNSGSSYPKLKQNVLQPHTKIVLSKDKNYSPTQDRQESSIRKNHSPITIPTTISSSSKNPVTVSPEKIATEEKTFHSLDKTDTNHSEERGLDLDLDWRRKTQERQEKTSASTNSLIKRSSRTVAEPSSSYLPKRSRNDDFHSSSICVPPAEPTSEFENKKSTNVLEHQPQYQLQLQSQLQGFQGMRNSCYADSSLFALFAYTSAFDQLLEKMKRRSGSKEDSLANKIRKIVRIDIVKPLRDVFYVPRENVWKIREILGSEINPEYLSDFMDVEEFLVHLFELMQTPELLQYDSEHGDFIHQIFLQEGRKTDRNSPDYSILEPLLESSLQIAGVQLAHKPKQGLIIKLPVSNGKLIGSKKGIIPNIMLNLVSGDGNPFTMTLTSVICLRYHHFVAFTRTGTNWNFMDSRPTTSRPETKVLTGFDEAIQRSLEKLQNRGRISPKQENAVNCNEYNLFRDAYICIYT